MNLEYSVTVNDNGKTIKDILLSCLHISHSLLITLKRENAIFLNGVPAFVYKNVYANDVVSISFDYIEDNSNIVSKQIPLDIVYEDEWLLIINKPAGIPVHPSILHYEDSLSSGIKFYFDSINLHKKIRPVNRIDKDTSGLVVFAKNEYIQEALIKQMQCGIFHKEYIAIVEGFFDDNKKSGTINAPISRHEDSIIERCVSDDGIPSVTHYEVIKESEIQGIKFSVLKCKLETGRTHQIRVHMSYLGHPLLGDDLYGGNVSLINRQALHSYKISFMHPISKENVVVKTSISEDLNKLLDFYI